jgi:hypothetical protein
MNEAEIFVKQLEATASQYQKQFPAWRKGQAFFNALMELSPLLAEEVRGTDLDPFHIDDKVEAFLMWVEENYKETE